ncbi:MAG: flgB [Hyphomicrobiales bacterium]|jgi:flagellar basal-body rod protein FlgB|nr:flgB [Hyphomicrobiales bacterium]
MGPLFLLDLAAQQARWLGTRQTAIAGNVSNVSTPGYKAVDVRPFQDVMDRTAMTLQTTSPAHMSIDPSDPRGNVVRPSDGWDTTYSGNNVTIEEQLLKAGEVNRGYALNTGIVKAFNRMMLASVKG